MYQFYGNDGCLAAIGYFLNGCLEGNDDLVVVKNNFSIELCPLASERQRMIFLYTTESGRSM